MITELRTLVAVARFGTFAAAGKRIGLTQAAVSGQMKRLEEKLGTELFDRTGRSATLNQTGRNVLLKAGEVLGLVDRLAEPQDRSAHSGHLRIGAISSVQPTLLKRALGPFHAAFPGFYVQILPGTSMELMDRLDSGELDLAVVIEPSFGLPQELAWHPLTRERFVLAVPKTVAPANWRRILQDHPLLRYNRHSFGGRQVQRFLDQQGIPVRDWVEVDDIPALLAMVADGLGVAVLPRAEAYEEHFLNVRVLELEEDAFFREVGVLCPRDPDAPIARFIAECRIASAPLG
jgi:DNA-binding transcriptional LysR family regulator